MKSAKVWRPSMGILALLTLSVAALAGAPLAVEDGYSVVEHTVSESAAQGVEGAWLARLGFLLLGSGVAWLTALSGRRWGLAGTVMLGAFGVMMVSAAAFSSKPWQADAPYDSTEDLLHSIAASAMGVAFIVGLISIGAISATSRDRIIHYAVACLAVGLSIGLLAWEGGQGLLQRLMFLAGYVWFAREAWALRSNESPYTK
jgi:hypothetical protein